MYVQNKLMYHIHTSNEYDELWQEGNEIVVDDNFNSECGLSIPYFNTNVICSDESVNSLQYFLKKIFRPRNRKSRFKIIEALLKDSYRIIL